MASSVDFVLKTDLGQVLSKGLEELVRVKPEFPVSYLSEWLLKASKESQLKEALIHQNKQNEHNYSQALKRHAEKAAEDQQKIQKQVDIQKTAESTFLKHIEQTEYLEDVLKEWLPQHIEKQMKLTGCYVGSYDFPKKPLAEQGYEQGSENDTAQPKQIEYIGASTSHARLMLGKVLPQGKGICAWLTVPPEEPPPLQEGVEPPPPKPKYLFVPNVLQELNLHYFRYPRLGCFAGFPLLIKSCLRNQSFDQGVIDYKAYLKTKEETEKDFHEKLNEAKHESEEATKKFQDFEVNEQDPNSTAEKNNLEAQAAKFKAALEQMEANPPKVPFVTFQTVEKIFLIGVDTLGQDRVLTQKQLLWNEAKINHICSQWTKKQFAMLLSDVEAFLEEEPTLEAADNATQSFEKAILSDFQSSGKAQDPLRPKKTQFELAVFKAEKLVGYLADHSLQQSLAYYTRSHIPHFQEIIQIAEMLVGTDLVTINIPKTNRIDNRKAITLQKLQTLTAKLAAYQLHRDSSDQVSSELKISKLLERLQKIDVEATSKYNAWVNLLSKTLKALCWARMLCRDAKNEARQIKLKAKEDRDAEIIRYDEEMEKALEAAKAEAPPTEEGQEPFDEEKWRANYQNEQPKPQPLEAPETHQFLDLD